MKRKKRIIGLLLSALCTVCCVGCKTEQQNANNPPSSGNNGGYIADNPTQKTNIQTTHIYNVTEGTVDLVKNSATDFVIVYPQTSKNDEDLLFAIKELKAFFNEATGAVLHEKSDEEHAGTEKIISLGETAQRKANTQMQARLTEYELKSQGFVLDTIGSSVYITGNSSLAVLNGVYEFLKGQFHYSYYADGCYTLDTGVTNAKLKNFNVTDVPDIEYRVPGNGDDRISSTHVRRMKMNFSTDMYVSGIGNVHNYFEYVPKSIYLDEVNHPETYHPEWYSVGDGQLQLCFSRDPDGLREVVATKMKEVLLADPDKDYIMFAHNDGGTWCSCDDCTAEYGLYDQDIAANTATLLRFINPLAKEIKEWNERVCPERDIKIIILGYGRVRAVPVKMDANKNPIVDENGNYQLYDEQYRLEDNVVVQVCFGGDAYSVDSKTNQVVLEQNKRWQVACDTFLSWIYSADFNDYLRPMNSIEGRAGYYQYIVKELGGLYLFDNAQWDASYGSDWGTFKSFLESRLSWNCQISIDVLIEDFFNNYYGVAAPVMKTMLTEYRNYTAYLYNAGMSMMDVHGGDVECNTKNWPYKKVTEFLGYTQAAMETIEPLKKTAPDVYEALYTRILRESVTYRYMLIKLYSEIYSVTEYENVRAGLLNDCQMTGITKQREYGDIASYLG